MGTNTPFGTYVKSQVDASGATVLVGAGGNINIGKAGNSVIILGDSITANNTVVTSLTDYYNANGYWNYANIKLGQRCNLIRNAGVSGDTTTLVLARMDADVLAYNPKACVVMVGVNDIYAGAGTYADTVANLQTIYENLLAANILVIACTIMPTNAAYASYSAAKRQVNLRVNNWIRNYARNTDGVVLCDMHAAVVDHASATGDTVTNALYDNIHPSNKGAYLMGNALYTVLEPLFPLHEDLINSNVDNYGADSTNKNILDNGLFLTSVDTGGGVLIGTGWTAAAAAGSPTWTATTPARADGFGNDQQIVITSGAAADRVTLTTADLDARVSNSDVLVFEVEITSSSSTNLRNLQTNLLVQCGGQNYIVADLQRNDANDKVFTGEIGGVFRTRPLTVPSSGSITLVTASVSASFAGIGGTTLNIGRASIRKVE